MVSETEIKISVELSDVETDTLQVATNRYFHKQPYLAKWTAACAQFFSGKDVPANIDLCAGYIAQASAAGAALIVLPENSNRERDYFAGGKPSKELAYERCEAIDGEFITAIRAVAAEHSIWVAMGVDMRGEDESGNQCVHIAQLLIGRDGFIHGVHKKHVLWDYEYTLFEPAAAGDPYRVYDTELGRCLDTEWCCKVLRSACGQDWTAGLCRWHCSGVCACSRLHGRSGTVHTARTDC